MSPSAPSKRLQRSPHPATVAQPKAAITGPLPRPPHPATVAQPRRLPHPATAAQPRPASGGQMARPPHPATVAPPSPARAGSSPSARIAQRADNAPPTFKAPKWRDILDTGYHDKKPIYIHYTSEDGYRAIINEKTISDKKRGEKREGSKPGIYVNPVTQKFNPENVEILLFLGNDRYAGNGNYVVIFSSDLPVDDLGPVTEGSWVREYKLYGEVVLTKNNLIYGGRNPFPDVFA